MGVDVLVVHRLFGLHLRAYLQAPDRNRVSESPWKWKGGWKRIAQRPLPKP